MFFSRPVCPASVFHASAHRAKVVLAGNSSNAAARLLSMFKAGLSADFAASLIKQFRAPAGDSQIPDSFFHYRGRFAGLPFGPVRAGNNCFPKRPKARERANPHDPIAAETSVPALPGCDPTFGLSPTSNFFDQSRAPRWAVVDSTLQTSNPCHALQRAGTGSVLLLQRFR